MKTLLFSLFRFYIALSFLLSVSTLYAQSIQNWEISILDQTQQVQATASMQCLPGGACDASSWTLLRRADFGCDYKLDFSVQFSGDTVRLLLFHTSLDSTCANMRLLMATGTGTADAPYPAANNASGEVTLGFEVGGRGGPGAEPGSNNSMGTTRWLARRL